MKEGGGDRTARRASSPRTHDHGVEDTLVHDTGHGRACARCVVRCGDVNRFAMEISLEESKDFIDKRFHSTLRGQLPRMPVTMESLTRASGHYISILEQGGRRLPPGERVDVPTGVLICPRDTNPPPPTSLIERSYRLVRRTDAANGGHFLALEQPGLFVEDVRAFFRAFR